MNLGQAQLGRSSIGTLGGYIPAPRKDTKLSEQVLAQILGSLAGQVTGAALEKITTPDPTEYLKSQGVNVEKPKWYQMPIKQGEAQRMVADRSQSELAKQRLTQEGTQFDKSVATKVDEAAKDRLLSEQLKRSELAFGEKSLGVNDARLREQMANDLALGKARLSLGGREQELAEKNAEYNRGRDTAELNANVSLKGAQQALLDQQLQMGKGGPMDIFAKLDEANMRLAAGTPNPPETRKFMAEYMAQNPPDYTNLQPWFVKFQQAVNTKAAQQRPLKSR